MSLSVSTKIFGRSGGVCEYLLVGKVGDTKNEIEYKNFKHLF